MTRNTLNKVAETLLETDFGVFDILVYQEKKSGKEHIVLKKKWSQRTPLVRLHSECATGDIFSSTYCDCGQQLHHALKLIARQGGVLIYLKQEGRGLGLTNKIKAYEFQREGLDTVDANLKLGRGADERVYDIAVEILGDLGIKKLKLLTNNPLKIMGLQHHGIDVEPVSIQMKMKTERGKKYLASKKEKLGHRLDPV